MSGFVAPSGRLEFLLGLSESADGRSSGSFCVGWSFPESMGMTWFLFGLSRVSRLFLHFLDPTWDSFGCVRFSHGASGFSDSCFGFFGLRGPL